MMVVTVKYLVFLMRADNGGEGGIMALLALAPARHRNPGLGKVGWSGTMAITSVVYFFVVRYTWNWPLWKAAAVVGLFLAFDLPFLAANALKFVDGGYLPFGVGVLFVAVMVNWRIGRGLLALDGVPPAMRRAVARFRALQETIVLLTIVFEHVPRVASAERVQKVLALDKGFHRLTLHYGFLEEPDVHGDLAAVLPEMGIDTDHRARLRRRVRDLRGIGKRSDGQGLGKRLCVLVAQRKERNRLLQAST